MSKNIPLQDQLSGESGQSHLPLWTWVASLPVFALASLASLAFNIAPGIAVWYLPVPIGIVLIHWWGPRILVAMYLNAILFAGAWGLPRAELWPIYSWPEVCEVWLSWFLFSRVMKGRCWLPTPRDLYLFLTMGMTLPSIVMTLVIPGQLVLLGDLPLKDASRAALSGWVTDIISCLAVAVPLLMFGTARLAACGLALQSNASAPDLLDPRRSRMAAGAECLAIALTLVIVSRFMPISQSWALFGFSLLWISIRYEMGMVLIFNGFVIGLALLLPVFETLGFKKSWIEDGDLVQTNLSISMLCASALIIGRLVHSLKQESEVKLSRGLRLAKLINWTFSPDRALSNDGLYGYSPGVEELYGRSGAELSALADRFYDAVLHEEDRKDIKGRHEDFLASAAGSFDASYRIIRPDGEIRHVHETAEKIRDENGRMIQILGTIRDMTDIRRREIELIAARNEAMAANRSKSEFLANMSHELRTPLNAIIGFSQVIHTEMFGPANQRYVDYARDINASGDHLLKLISDVLDMSKLEVGKYRIQAVELDLNEQVELCLRMVTPRAEEKNIALSLKTRPDLPALIADERAVMQVLINLLSNAVKFTNAGGSVEVAIVAQKQGPLAITIRDNGVGIAPDVMPMLFLPFQQGTAQVSRTLGGSGLGLYISKELMTLHQGEIEVESTIGSGTIFNVRFPKERVKPKATADRAAAPVLV